MRCAECDEEIEDRGYFELAVFDKEGVEQDRLRFGSTSCLLQGAAKADIAKAMHDAWMREHRN